MSESTFECFQNTVTYYIYIGVRYPTWLIIMNIALVNFTSNMFPQVSVIGAIMSYNIFFIFPFLALLIIFTSLTLTSSWFTVWITLLQLGKYTVVDFLEPFPLMLPSRIFNAFWVFILSWQLMVPTVSSFSLINSLVNFCLHLLQ